MPGASLNPVLEKLEQADKRAVEHAGEQKRPWYIIDPRSSSAIGYWDLLTSFALVFTAIVTPFEVAYLNPPTGSRWEDPLFLCNRIIDLVFITDMGIQFFLGFSRANSSQGMIWVFDHKQILLHYVTSFWFFLDFISITSSIPDIAEIKGVEDLTILRIIRVIRLIKLVRVLRGSRLFKRWEIRFSIDYAMLSLSSSMGSIGLTCHWFACIWGLQASFAPLDGWPGDQGYCQPFGNGPEALVGNLTCTVDSNTWCMESVCVDGFCEGGWTCYDAATLYVESIYTAVATCTSGGAYTAAFTNTSEKAIATLMVLFSGVLWSQLIGVLCSVASNMSPMKQAFRKDLTELNTFMTNNSLDPRTRFRLREYLHQSVHMKNAASQKRILAQLSPGLHSEVVWRITQQWLRSVRFLQGVEKELLIALAFHVNARVFPPEEICPHGVLYIIFKGTALYAGKLHKSGMCFGEDILMKRPDYIFPNHGIAITYLWVYTLDGRIIRDCLSLYPDSTLRIRATNMRWMMARMIIRAARRIKEVRKALNPSLVEGADPFDLLKLYKEPRKEDEATDHGNDNDGKAAAQRYAAQYAQREAEAQSDGDRISNLQTEMKEMKEMQEDILRLLRGQMPRADSPTGDETADYKLGPLQV